MARRTSRRRRGRFIVLEGIDGSGTTTQLAALRDALQARGVRCLSTFQPSPGVVGQMLRQVLGGRLGPLDPRATALLFAADRADHAARVVLPALARGELVLCDRYLLSSLAYQGLDLKREYIEAINAGSPRPDLTLFLAVPPRLAAQRRHERGGPAELYDALALQRRIDRGYRSAVQRRRRRERIVVVDGARPVEAVTAELLEHITALLGR